MSLISRITTWTVGQILKAADLNGEFNNIVNLFNNLDAGSTTWTNCNSTNSTQTSSTITTATVTTLTNQIQKYRRPVLQYNSGTVVNIETGINGTSGQLGIMFPDGTYRTDSTAGRIQCNLAQNAVLTGTTKSGLDTGSQSANLWYSIYAVKSQANSTDIIAVASLNLPIQANFSTLNSNFGTNSWVYLGMVRNGDNAGSTNVVLKFVQSGNITLLYNVCVDSGGANQTINGFFLAGTTSGATSTYSYAAGTGTTQIPNHILNAFVSTYQSGSTTGQVRLQDSGGNFNYALAPTGTTSVLSVNQWVVITQGIKFTATGGTSSVSIALTGWIDGVLGVSGNAIL